MAKHKTVTHLPAPPPAAPAPRLAAQMLVAIGELITVALVMLGAVTLAMWIIRPVDAPVLRRAPTSWMCWLDRYGEHCDRPPARRHYAWDGY